MNTNTGPISIEEAFSKGVIKMGYGHLVPLCGIVSPETFYDHPLAPEGRRALMNLAKIKDLTPPRGMLFS